MKALVYTAPGKVELQNISTPHAKSDEVIVRVQFAGICGSDMGGFLGHHARRQPPLVLGHEMVGIVKESSQEKFPCGKRVVVNPLLPCFRCSNCLSGRHNTCYRWKLLGMDNVQRAFAEQVSVPVSSLFSIPENLPDEVAVLPEPVACAVHLLSMIESDKFGTLAILGAGTQGILVLILAKLLGYQSILITDINQKRLSVASQLGATQILNPSEIDLVSSVHDLTDGLGVEVVVDAVGSSSTRQQATEICQSGGQVILLGLAEQKTEIDFMNLVRREIQLQTSFGYNMNDFSKAVSLVVSGKVNVTPWTEIKMIEEGQMAFEKMINNPSSTIKMILRP